MKTAEGTERISRSLKKFKLPTAAGEPNLEAVTVKKINLFQKNNLECYQKPIWYL
jgi:hypothetical protein